ncbi:MAG: ABC transporter ATP-binding protein [Actinomycetota bacterium]
MPETSATAEMNGVAEAATVLDVTDVCSGYGTVQVLHDISFEVRNEIFAILGANGAGKTTLLRTLARLLPVMSGSITFGGTDVTNAAAHKTARLGIGYVPQEAAVFPDLSVQENLAVGAMIGTRPVEERLEEVFTTFPDLRSKTHLRAGNLSGGESRMVACGRALMQDPQVLLLDEPTAGLSPLYVEQFFETIESIHATRDVAVVLTEQNASKALGIADRVMVLSLGEGSDPVDADEVTTERLKEAYKL